MYLILILSVVLVYLVKRGCVEWKLRKLKKKTLQDKNMILLLENDIRGVISNVIGDRYKK